MPAFDPAVRGNVTPDNVRAIDCQTAVRQLWDYLDEELDDQRMGEVKRHLDSCNGIASRTPSSEGVSWRRWVAP
jgi:hypothetical protein